MLKLSATDGRELYQKFQDTYKIVLEGIEKIEDEPSYRSKTVSKRFLMPLIYVGMDLAKLILQNKSIPSRHKKDLEMATRAFMKVKRAPTKPRSWIQRNEKRIKFLLSTQKFPEKSLGQDELFKIGPFEVHNTIGAEGKELDMTKDLIRKSHKIIKSSSIPHTSKILYGKVFLTGQLLRAHTLAWYDPGEDTISIRIRKKIDSDALHSLTHEFGHRLWRLFLEKDKKRQWTRHHHKVGRSSDMPMPDVGDPLGFPLKGMKEPVILRKEGEKFYVSDDGYLTYKQILNAYKEEFSYPTRYSSTSEEEHFCEAFAMYCMGVLPSDHENSFEKYIIRGEEFVWGSN